MRSKLAIIILFAIAASSCDEEKGLRGCGVEDPVHDLPWLNDKVAEYAKYPDWYLVEATLHGNTVYFFASCCPACSWALVPYNCDGQEIEIANPGFDDFKDQEVIWKPEGFTCNL